MESFGKPEDIPEALSWGSEFYLGEMLAGLGLLALSDRLRGPSDEVSCCQRCRGTFPLGASLPDCSPCLSAWHMGVWTVEVSCSQLLGEILIFPLNLFL